MVVSRFLGHAARSGPPIITGDLYDGVGGIGQSI
jgi:hypothetical protein